MTSKNQTVEVSEIVDTSPHNEAIYEAGKSLLIESINTGRDFCKFMITMSTGAIPIYLGLLKFVMPEKHTLTLNQGVYAVIPAIVFFISTIIFTIAYFPQAGKFSLDIIEEIEREREKTIRKRKNLTWIGFSFFLLGLLIMIFSIMTFMTEILNKES